MTTYREQLRELAAAATPARWTSEGELYGVLENGVFSPLGFAPHRPLDARLVAVYRSAVTELIAALDAVERLAHRGTGAAPAPVAIGIPQILAILDRNGGAEAGYRDALTRLDLRTTPPPWDPGHLILGMELDSGHRSLGIATPRPADPPLIAAARHAVPRALSLLSAVEAVARDRGLPDGRLNGEDVAAITAMVDLFDGHSVTEGRGTGTV